MTKDGSPEGAAAATAAAAAAATAATLVNPRLYRCASVADEMNPRKRNTMEDVHRLVPIFDGNPDMSFFGVYDGHGGRGIVDFLETRLEQNIAEELRQKDSAGIAERIRRAYLATDVESKAVNLVTSGATVVTCLLKREQDKRLMLYTANVGDSRAVLFRDGKTVRLTHDHKADDASEHKRIEAAGGFILRNRVLGILAVARSFGDHGMKEFVSAEPYSSETDVTDCTQCRFLIMACDGVWDCIDDETACQLVQDELQAGREEAAARLLVNQALERGSTDNITCIVVFF